MLKQLVLCAVALATPFADDQEAYIQQADIPASWVPLASRRICDFQGKWHLLLDKSESLDPILTGLQFGWFKKKALKNFAPTTYVRFSDRACYGSDAAYETAMSALENLLPKDEESAFDWGQSVDNDGELDSLAGEAAGKENGDDGEMAPENRGLSSVDDELMEGMRITIVRAEAASALTTTRRSMLYMYMKTLFPWHNVKEGVVAVDGPVFEHFDSDTGLWSSAVTFENGRIYQKRVSQEYGTMYDIRAVFMPQSYEAAREEELLRASAADDNKLLNLTTWTGTRPLMLFKWTLVTPDGQIYSTIRWNEKMDYDPSDGEDFSS